MAEWLDDEVETCVGAILAVFKALGKKVDVRKVFWANYPILSLERDRLEEMVKKDTKKLEKEFNVELYHSKLWYIGVPTFKLIRRGVPYLSCAIDLYYAACGTSDENCPFCWFGKTVTKADAFDVPLCLIRRLLDALQKSETESKEAPVIERGPGYSVYNFMGREWKIPDAFLGFLLALKDKGEDFQGILDPVSCLLIDKFAKELPTPEAPKPTVTDDYQDVVSCLKEQMGYPKTEAEKAAKHVIDKVPNESLENKIKQALKYLSG